MVGPFIGWAALLLPPLPALVTLAVGFAGVYLMNREAIARGLAPPWYDRLRAPLRQFLIPVVARSPSSR